MTALIRLMYAVLRPLLFLMDPERAHTFTMRMYSVMLRVPGKAWIMQKILTVDDPALRTTVAGLTMPNPVGLAAGFDKNAVYFSQLHTLGFGAIEVGTLTAHAQEGNPLPRLFRLPEDRALINRFGFNNRGSAAAADAFSRNVDRAQDLVLGINIGKSKITPNEAAVSDYLTSFDRLADYADYVTINVSSPNTEGLRDLQETASLRALLEAVLKANADKPSRSGTPRPVFVKIAPDLTDPQARQIVDLAVDTGLDGIIATNTTIERSPLTTPQARIEAIGNGGLSGAPLTQRSRTFVARLYAAADGRIPIIGVGGIMNGDDAWDMICAGASAVQVYTGFIYGGPTFVHDINATLLRRLREAGLSNISEAVGSRNDALIQG